jgi:hypothetical protein
MKLRKTSKDKAAAFWKWFSENNTKFLFLSDVGDEEKEAMMDDLLAQLHKYSKNLFFEIGADPKEQQMELIITAEGVEEHFPKVEELVDAAPAIPRWRIVKFRQPSGNTFTLDFGDKSYEPEKIIFISLFNEDDPDGLGIQICFEDYTEEERGSFLQAAFIMLDSLLGEKSAVEDIEFVDVAKTPDEIDPSHYPTLSELPRVIMERKVFKYPGERFSVIDHVDENDYLVFITANFAYQEFAHKGEFPWFLRITIDVVDYNENGHPMDDEAETLNSFEDFLDSKIKEGAIAHYIGRTTLYKKRELLYYLNTPDKVRFILDSIREDAVPVRNFEYTIQKDTEWREVDYILNRADEQLNSLPGK